MTGQVSAATKPEPQPRAFTPTNPVEHAAEQLVEGVGRLIKPRLRGWIHVHSAAVTVVAGAALVAVSWAVASTRAGLATLTYTLAAVAMFAVSAIYHRIHWKSTTARYRMKRLDHSMIFVFIAGSYTPFAMLAMPPHVGRLVLWIVWGGALAGIVLKVCWPSAPRWVGLPLYLLLSWVAVWFTGTILHGAGVAAFVLLIVGGVVYSVGGLLYGLRWPDPWPTTFGYHEFFHACTAVAAICHYIAMWFAAF
ncbi:MAG TPA: hemolysin III family protein [Mycobacterium sp.]|nr:hemolysin III family protein [Mycobacterium sp.]